MKSELQTLIRALEAEAFNVSAESMSTRSALLDRARMLDALDESELSAVVAAAHAGVRELALDSDTLPELERKLLAMLNGTEDEDEDEHEEEGA